jgi:hypothetical protein
MDVFTRLSEDDTRWLEQNFPAVHNLIKERLMKKHAASLLILMLATLTGLASAQTAKVITAQVPFDYVVNGKTMLAGECSIKAQGDGQRVLWIASENTGMYVLPNATESTAASDRTKLIFHRYGDRYFLASIEREGESRGYELPASKLEAELRAQNVAEKDVVLLASAE